MAADIQQLMKDWELTAAMIRKPRFSDTCDLIQNLCMEIKELRKEVEYQKKRQDVEEQKYKTMLLEVQNVVTRYFRDLPPSTTTQR